MREATARKVGLRLGPNKVQHLNDRQIFVKKSAPNPPSSVFALQEAYV